MTTGSMIYRATLEQAAQVAEYAGLRKVTSADWDEVRAARDANKSYPERGTFHRWEDAALGGGACRLVWKSSVVWVSRHAGYPQADLTEEACFFFEEMGCRGLAYTAAPGTIGYHS